MAKMLSRRKWLVHNVWWNGILCCCITMYFISSQANEHQSTVHGAVVKSQYRMAPSEQELQYFRQNDLNTEGYDVSKVFVDTLVELFQLDKRCGTVIDLAPANGAVLNRLRQIKCQVYGIKDPDYPNTGLWMPTNLLPEKLAVDPSTFQAAIDELVRIEPDGKEDYLREYLYNVYSRTMVYNFTNYDLQLPIHRPSLVLVVDVLHHLPLDVAIHAVQSIAAAEPEIIVLSEPTKGELYWRNVISNNTIGGKELVPNWHKHFQDRGYVLDPLLNTLIKRSISQKSRNNSVSYPWLLKNVAVLVRNETLKETSDLRDRAHKLDGQEWSMSWIQVQEIAENYVPSSERDNFHRWASEAGNSLIKSLTSELEKIKNSEKLFLSHAHARNRFEQALQNIKPPGIYHTGSEYLQAWSLEDRDIVEQMFLRDLETLRMKNQTHTFGTESAAWFRSLNYEIIEGALQNLPVMVAAKSAYTFCLVSRIASPRSTEDLLWKHVERNVHATAGILLLYCPYADIGLQNKVLYNMNSALFDHWFDKMVQMYMDGGSASRIFANTMTTVENELLELKKVEFAPYGASIQWRYFGLGIPRPVVLPSLHAEWNLSIGSFESPADFMEACRKNKKLLHQLESMLNRKPMTLLQKNRYFHVSYTNEQSETTLKQSFNEEQLWYNVALQTKLSESFSPQNTTQKVLPKVLVVSAQWFETHSVFRNFASFVHRLNTRVDFDAHLLFLDSNFHVLDESEHPDFKKIFHMPSSGELEEVEKLASSLLEEHYDIVYYTQVGMHPKDIDFANLQLAPIQIVSYGHSSSSHGALLDYFIGGWEAEVATPVQTAYEQAIARIQLGNFECDESCIIDTVKNNLEIYKNASHYPARYFDTRKMNSAFSSTVSGNYHLSRIPSRIFEAYLDPELHLQKVSEPHSVNFVNRLRINEPELFRDIEKFAQARYSERLILVPGMGVSFRPQSTVYKSKVSNETAFHAFTELFRNCTGLETNTSTLSMARFAQIYPPTVMSEKLTSRTIKLSFPWTKVKLLHHHLARIGKLIREALDLGNLHYELHFSPGLDDDTILQPLTAMEAIEESLNLGGLKRVRTVLHSRYAPLEFLGHLSGMDVGIDSAPFGACNSVQNMVHVGVIPLVLHGQIWRNQIGAAMLRRAGLEELVSSSETEFIRKGARLISDPLYMSYMKWRVSCLDAVSLWHNERDIAAWDHIWPELERQSKDRRQLYPNFPQKSVQQTLQSLCASCFTSENASISSTEIHELTTRPPLFLRHPIWS